MNNRTVKWGALGALLAGVAVGVYPLHAVSIETVQFREILRAMKEAPWVHASIYGYGRSMTGLTEFWIGFKEDIFSGRAPDGKVSFCSLEELQTAEYDPNGKTIALWHMEEQKSSPRMLSPLLVVGDMQQRLTEHGGKTAVHIVRYHGREVRVQQTSLSTRGQRIKRYVMKLYIDPQSKLLRAVQVVARDAAGAIVTAGHIAFDYPQTGPQDIYDLDVPLEARIVNNMPADDWRTVREWYRKIRAETTREYIAVVVHQDSNLGDVTRLIDVDDKSGSMRRQERHLVLSRDKPFD